MRRQLVAFTLLAATSVAMTCPARAQASKDMLNQARTQAERQALEDLIGKLENRAGQRTQAAPTPRQPDEETKAEELARQLRDAPPPATPAAIEPPRSEPAISATVPPSTVLAPLSPPAESVIRTMPAEQPIATPRSDEAAKPAAVAIQVAPPPQAAPEPEMSSKAAAPTAALPRLPPLQQHRPPPPPAAKRTEDAEARPPTPPPKRITASSRKALCTEILQRASVGDLSDQDREFLKSQCH